MRYYRDGRLYDHDEYPAIIKVDGNDKEIEKAKIRIKRRELEDILFNVNRLIIKSESFPKIVKSLKLVKDDIIKEKELNLNYIEK